MKMLTDKNLSDIAKGRSLVDRDVLLDMIYSMLYAMGPTVSLEEVCEFENRCISLAQESWLELLLDILLKPPADFEDFEGDGWDATIWMLLHGAAAKFPRTGLEVALKHFPGEGERLRTAVIETLGATSLAESFPYVDSYFSQIGQLTEDEMINLIDAYGNIGGEKCVARLKEIANYLEMQHWEEHSRYCIQVELEVSLIRAAAKSTQVSG